MENADWSVILLQQGVGCCSGASSTRNKCVVSVFYLFLFLSLLCLWSEQQPTTPARPHPGSVDFGLLNTRMRVVITHPLTSYYSIARFSLDDCLLFSSFSLWFFCMMMMFILLLVCFHHGWSIGWLSYAREVFFGLIEVRLVVTIVI